MAAADVAHKRVTAADVEHKRVATVDVAHEYVGSADVALGNVAAADVARCPVSPSFQGAYHVSQGSTNEQRCCSPSYHWGTCSAEGSYSIPSSISSLPRLTNIVCWSSESQRAGHIFRVRFVPTDGIKFHRGLYC